MSIRERACACVCVCVCESICVYIHMFVWEIVCVKDRKCSSVCEREGVKRVCL